MCFYFLIFKKKLFLFILFYIKENSYRLNDDLTKKSYEANMQRRSRNLELEQSLASSNRHSFNANMTKSESENKFNEYLRLNPPKSSFKTPERAEFEFEVHNPYEDDEYYEDDDDYEDEDEDEENEDDDDDNHDEDQDEEEEETDEATDSNESISYDDKMANAKKATPISQISKDDDDEEGDDQETSSEEDYEDEEDEEDDEGKENEEDEDEDEDEEEEEEDNEEEEELENCLQKEQKKILEVFQDIQHDISEMKNNHPNSDKKFSIVQESLSATSSSKKTDSETALIATKLKKFNINNTVETVEKTNKHLKEIEQIDQQRRQEVLKAQSEIEKNKNILRDLLYDKTNSSPDDLSAVLRIKSNYFTCQMCKQTASITQRTRIFGVIYHRDCLKCNVCGIVVRNAESLSQKENDKSNFKFFIFCL